VYVLVGACVCARVHTCECRHLLRQSPGNVQRGYRRQGDVWVAGPLASKVSSLSYLWKAHHQGLWL
jgi:hypothetical protein